MIKNPSPAQYTGGGRLNESEIEVCLFLNEVVLKQFSFISRV